MNWSQHWPAVSPDRHSINGMTSYPRTITVVSVVGLALVALFAAAMSSLDSVINSLSATTMEDFVRRFHSGGKWSDTRELLYSRLLTVAWGAVTLSMAFYVGDIADTVLVTINKIGSLINGPVLGVFVLGILTRRCNGLGAHPLLRCTTGRYRRTPAEQARADG